MQLQSHITERLSKGLRNGTIAEMMAHQDRVRFHADGCAMRGYGNMQMAAFLNWVKGIGVADDKFKTFEHLLTLPLQTSSIVDTVFDRLGRIFEGRNPVYNYQFRKSEYSDDWEWYRQEVLHEPDVWKTKGWQYFKTECNSVLVVDMPVDGRSDKSDKYLQPYFYWVCVENIIDFEADSQCNFKWFAYKDEDLRLAYLIDDEYYRVFEYGISGNHGLGELVSEKKHSLGYCPCRFFVSDSITLQKPFVKRSPITKVLGDLDWYLYFATSKKHLDSYAAYPILSSYEFACDYETELNVSGEKLHLHCKNGFLADDSDELVHDATGQPKSCPVCGNKRLVNPGSYVVVPWPENAGGFDLRNPVNMLPVDRGSLDYCTEELDRLRQNIISKCVGIDGDAVNQFSISDKQVDANFETQSTVLLRVKKNFEEAQKFVDETVCRLRYGNNYVSCAINYGTEFYTLSTAELRDRLKKAVESGASESDLMSLRRQIIETEYRNNPLQMQRMLILLDVEPLVGMSVNDAINAATNGIVNTDDVKIKADFDTLIRRFERENENVIEFGCMEMDYRTKINTIKSKLRDYVREN